MDNNKKEKLVAILLTTLVSLAVSAVACVLGVSPDAITGSVADTNTVCTATIVEY